jgi:squalene synthase HpnC
MTTVTAARSGKTHHDENFPVASWLLAEQHRRPILAFYRFARAADDVSDHPTLQPQDKLALLDRMGVSLAGQGGSDPEAEPLRAALADSGLPARHALDLLDAFRLDVRKLRYDDWRDLMDYCRLSAMPVGRFVLDVHKESQATWPASDALCAALQVINHLQDCAKDYRMLDRVYLPQDVLAAHGATTEMLAGARSTPALLGAIRELARRTSELLRDAAPLSRQVTDLRLSLEIAAIQALAEHLARRLTMRDPLSESVHLGKLGSAALGGLGAVRAIVSRFARPFAAGRSASP